MKILVDDEKLDLLLLAHKSDIWLSKTAKFRHVLDQLTLAVAVYTATFPNIYFTCVFYTITTCTIIWSVWQMLASENYSTEKLHKDIQSLNEITHPYSLVAIKDTFNDHPSRFLVYYDKKWKCKFFPNYKTAPEDNETGLRSRLANDLKLDPAYITVEKQAERIQKKFNPAEQVAKTYCHTLYYTQLANVPEAYKQPIFEVDGKSYYWMTIAEMEQDKDIVEKNLEVVSFVKEIVP